jgi:hypothetical protein
MAAVSNQPQSSTKETEPGPRKISLHWRDRGQPEKNNPAKLNIFGNNHRIKYLENQAHAEETETPLNYKPPPWGGNAEPVTTKHLEIAHNQRISNQ